MLVVSRKVGERIHIGDEITLTVVKVGASGVRLGIDAPAELAIMREELAVSMRKAEQEAIAAASERSIIPISEGMQTSEGPSSADRPAALGGDSEPNRRGP